MGSGVGNFFEICTRSRRRCCNSYQGNHSNVNLQFRKASNLFQCKTQEGFLNLSGNESDHVLVAISNLC